MWAFAGEEREGCEMRWKRKGGLWTREVEFVGPDSMVLLERSSEVVS